MPYSAVVLFSGGIDSTTTLAIALQEGFHVIALSFDYGQRHIIELEKSKKVLSQFSVKEHMTIRIDLRAIGGSALTSKIDVPKGRMIDHSIPITYVPGRNLIFLSFAAALGETSNAYDLFYGANVLDYSGYPDCRPEFMEALEKTLNAGMKAGVEGKGFRIHAPLLKMTKSEIIRKGLELRVDYTHTHSCYDPAPDGLACGACDSCRIRQKGFDEIGIADPASAENKRKKK
ncbi:MAG: 7-cyano-7-deazaguanine synthase QueC [Acidobacteria bacterium]|nr:MAG: 7-cyano-7-deazaguanine synthase QueC [Acidobacteriota bacterium]